MTQNKRDKTSEAPELITYMLTCSTEPYGIKVLGKHLNAHVVKCSIGVWLKRFS